MTTQSPTLASQATAELPGSALNIPAGPEDHEIEDMAHSACQEALSFGLSVDSFMRPLKSLAKKFRAAAPTPPVDAVPGEPLDLGPVYVPDDQGPEDVRYVREDRALAAIASAASVASRAGSEPMAAKVTEISNALAKTQWASEQQRSDWIAYAMSLVRELATIAPAAAAEPSELTTCNCRWQGEKLVQQCTLHEAWRDAIRDWSERAKVAERELSDRERAASLVAGELVNLTDMEIAALWPNVRFDICEGADDVISFGRAVLSAAARQPAAVEPKSSAGEAQS